MKVCKLKPLVNSIMARPERYTVMIPLVAKYNAQVVALMWGPEGLPRDENERAALAAELDTPMNEAGIPNEDIFFVWDRHPGQYSAAPVDESYGLPGDGSGYRPRGQIHLRSFPTAPTERPIGPSSIRPSWSCLRAGHVLLHRRPRRPQLMAIAKGQRPDVVK